jgi:hypothetical protein
MAEIEQPNPTPAAPVVTESAAPVVTESAAPVVVTPVPAAPAVPVEAPAPVVAPAAEPAPVVPEAPAAPAVEPEKSLLETFGEQAPPPAEPAPPFDYKYELPTTLTVDDTQRAELHSALDTFRTNPTEGAQALLDLHAAKMQEFADKTLENQVKAWNETRQTWRDAVKADEQLGGPGYQTTQAAIARMRDLFVPKAERAGFTEFLRVTGAGDHPAFLRMLHNVARRFDEAGPPPPNPQPPNDIGKAPKQGRSSLYDHPSSQKG